MEKRNIRDLDYFRKFPPGIRQELLLEFGNKYSFDRENEDLGKILLQEMTQIEDVIVGRNLRGIALEKEGKIDEAIEVYELNKHDMATTPHPYDRLRIIYTKQKNYIKAIEACHAAIYTYRALAKAMGKKRPDIIQKYQAWIQKLETKRKNMVKPK